MSDLLLATFHVGDLLLGMPVSAVQEVVDVEQVVPVPLAAADVSGLINLRGRIVVAVDVRASLGLPPRPEGPSRVHVVVAADGEPASLVVDEVGDVLPVPETAREEVPETVAPALRRLVTGAFQLDSALLLVLDPDLVLAL